MKTTNVNSTEMKEEETLLEPTSKSENTPRSHYLKRLHTWIVNLLRIGGERKRLLLVFFAAFLNAVRGILTKIVINDIHPLEITAIERAVTCLCCFPWIIRTDSPVLEKTEFAYTIFSGLLHALAATSMNFSTKFLEVADSTAIVSSKVAFVALFGTIMLRESLSTVDVLSVFLSVTALVLLAKPISLFTNLDPTFIAGLFFALSSASLGAMNTIAKRWIGINRIDPQIALMYTALVSTLITGGFSAVIGTLVIPNNIKTSIITLSSGLLGYLANILTFMALHTEYALHVTIVGSTKIIFVFVLEIFTLSVQPDVFSVSGGLLMVSSILIYSFKTARDDDE